MGPVNLKQQKPSSLIQSAKANEIILHSPTI
jgi:hypothetical protein